MELTQKEKDTITDLVKACELTIFESTGKKVNLFFQHKVVEKAKLTMEQVTDIVCRELEVDYDKVFERTRVRKIADARQIAIYLISKNCNTTLSKIGRFLNYRDHSTAHYSIKQVKAICDVDGSYRSKLAKVELALLTAQTEETFNN